MSSRTDNSLQFSADFFRSILDSQVSPVAVMDNYGEVVFRNQNWQKFAASSCHTIAWLGQDANYLQACDQAARKGNEYAKMAGDGIRQVMAQESEMFYFEHPCDGSEQRRWFVMRVTPLVYDNDRYYVIVHQDITEQKLAEERVRSQSRIDGLTGIYNRQYFEEFFQEEWKRCARLNQPVSLALLDIDHFKMLNDTYGHLVGDECLRKVATAIQEYARRPGDICARYGGEEFALLFGNTDLEQSLEIVSELHEHIVRLGIPNKNSSPLPVLTVSVGLAVAHPYGIASNDELVREADRLLYIAKDQGRNRVVYENKPAADQFDAGIRD